MSASADATRFREEEVTRRILACIGDTMHDMGKGQRVTTSTKEYVAKKLFSTAEYQGIFQQFSKLLAKANSENLLDELLHGYTEPARSIPFSDLEQQGTVEDFIYSPEYNRKKTAIIVPYGDLWKLSKWFSKLFVDDQRFTLDVSLLREELFCAMNATPKIEKSVATKYDRNINNTLNSMYPGCVITNDKVSISLSKQHGELLFLDKVVIEADDNNIIKWVVGSDNSKLEGQIDIARIVDSRNTAKNLTLFGAQISNITEILSDPRQEKKRTRQPDDAASPAQEATKRARQDSVSGGGKTLVSSVEELGNVINNLYGLDINKFNLNSQESMKIYIGILTDFKRLGDLLQIKVAKMGNNVFVSNDIVATILSSSSYNVPTIRTGKTSQYIDEAQDDHSNRTIVLYNIKTEGFAQRYMEYRRTILKTYKRYLELYKQIKQVLDTDPRSYAINSLGVLITQLVNNLNHILNGVVEGVVSDNGGRVTKVNNKFNLGMRIVTVYKLLALQMYTILHSLSNIQNTDAYEFDTMIKEIDEGVETQGIVQLQDRTSQFFQTKGLPYPEELVDIDRIGGNVSAELRNVFDIMPNVIGDISKSIASPIALSSNQFMSKYIRAFVASESVFNFPNNTILDLLRHYAETFRPGREFTINVNLAETTGNASHFQMEIGYVTNVQKLQDLDTRYEVLVGTYLNMIKRYDMEWGPIQGGFSKALSILPPITQVLRTNAFVKNTNLKQQMSVLRPKRPKLSALTRRALEAYMMSWVQPDYGSFDVRTYIMNLVGDRLHGSDANLVLYMQLWFLSEVLGIGMYVSHVSTM